MGDPMDGSVHQPPTPRKLWVDPNPSHSPKTWGLSPSPAPQRVPVAPFRGTAALGSPGRTPPWGHCRPRVPPGRGSGDTQGGDRIPWVAPGQGWHPIITSPCPQPRCPPPHPTPPTPRAPSSLCPRLGVPLGIQAPVQLWVGGVWVIVLIQKVQGVVAGQPPDGEFVGHFGPLLPVAGDALVQLRGFGKEVLQQPGGAKGGLMALWSPQPQRWISIGGAATQHGAMGCRGGDENAAL